MKILLSLILLVTLTSCQNLVDNAKIAVLYVISPPPKSPPEATTEYKE